MTDARRAPGGHAVSGFFVFCLIALFAVLATLLTLFGIRAYRSVYDASAMNGESQTVLSYIVNKVHSGDRAGGVTILDGKGAQALAIREPLDDGVYETRVYCYGGSLREYFCEPGDEFDPEYGEELTSLKALRFEWEEPWLLRVRIEREGAEPVEAHIALRGEVEP